ncbi:MAG TPA: asparagine synthase (glutamine-hydrolyzing) [Dissulfurispiraceae bacterium]
MCGIAGIYNLRGGEISTDTLKSMISVLRHRGPDGFGLYSDSRTGLAHARLSIIDLEGGRQPMRNEDGSVWIVFNGEIFNYKELREVLEKKGHRFLTRSDTEVIVHLYEDHGADCLEHLNGQFAFAVWDREKGTLFIARDRVGIRPAFYTFAGGSLLFASEVKSLFMDRRVKREIDPLALDQVFTFWMTVPPRTSFRDIFELPAGHYMLIREGDLKIVRYWDPDFLPDSPPGREDEYAEELRELLIDSTRLQLRADVPVGAYLSGGIDSATVAALVRHFTSAPLRTFSITFHDGTYDESGYQRQVIERLGTVHNEIKCACSDIGRVFPEVVWHTEKPVVRTAPAPLFLLSKLVRDSGYKVVLTGEGADEVLAGYDIFKETKVRRFLQRQPGSGFRPLILKRLYPYLAHSPVRSLPYAEAFFNTGAAGYPDAYYSHIPRWNTTSKMKTFFSDSLKEAVSGHESVEGLSSFLTDDLGRYDHLSRAQYIEIKMLLSGYLLSSQGDRVAMAHSIESRYPFLDHRVMEFCCKLPPAVRMNTLAEKYLLKKSMKDLLPPSVIQRTKQPYMAPDAKSFFNGERLDYVEELLSEGHLHSTGYFDPAAVSLLVKKSRGSPFLGFKDNMAVVGILSTLLLHHLFIDNFHPDTEGQKTWEGKFYEAGNRNQEFHH